MPWSLLQIIPFYCLTSSFYVIETSKDKREIPKNLLRKMVKMKIKTEGVKIIDSPPRHHRDVLPLSLVYLSHRYSLSLNTQQESVEVVIEEIWKEEWEKQFSIQAETPYENFSHKSPSLFSTFHQHSRLVRCWLPGII